MCKHEAITYAVHKECIEQYLAGQEVDPTRLWLSVGYFYEGDGAFRDRSFIPAEKWEELLRETGRAVDC
jgi:hypothetical protein